MSDAVLYLAQAAVQLVLPETLFVLVLLVGLGALWRGWWRSGRAAVTIAAFCLTVIGPLPFGAVLLETLEDSYPRAPEVVSPSTIVVLSGGEQGAVNVDTGHITLSAGSDRLSAALLLARRFPEAWVLFVGQSMHLPDGTFLPQAYLQRNGLDPERLSVEPLSRNTLENSRFSLRMAPPEGPYLLVTSAFHMRRAVGMFCKAGWQELVPWPVDYRSRGWTNVRWEPTYNMSLLNTAVREHLSLLAYRLGGQLAGEQGLETCLAQPEIRTGSVAGPG